LPLKSEIHPPAPAAGAFSSAAAETEAGHEDRQHGELQYQSHLHVLLLCIGLPLFR
jgi:hypothetical protein